MYFGIIFARINEICISRFVFKLLGIWQRMIVDAGHCRKYFMQVNIHQRGFWCDASLLYKYPGESHNRQVQQ